MAARLSTMEYDNLDGQLLAIRHQSGQLLSEAGDDNQT
jgi:hypothetical protein